MAEFDGDLREKIAIVTGGSRGIGRQIARVLAARGCRVVVVARTPAAVTATAERIETETGSVCLPIVSDVTVPADRNEILELTEGRIGPPDILVNCASIARVTRFVDEDPGRVIATNLHAPIETTRLIVPGMVQRGQGAVLNVASLAGKVGLPFLAEYSAAKAGLIAFSRSAREELRGTGVSVTVASPGFVVDQGMYVAYRTPPPWYFGSNSSADVATKAVKALCRSRPDVILNSRPVRPLLMIDQISEAVMRSALRFFGTTDFMRALADKRLPYSDSLELLAPSDETENPHVA